MRGQAHPNIHPPWRPWSEDQTLHLVGVYMNPMRYTTRRKLFNDFVYHMEHAPNIELHVVEVAFGDRPFEVTGTRPNDVQLRSTSVMWQKEIAINLAVQTFPTGWKYGGYSDGDFHYTRHDWGLEAIHLLQHHHFVQLFSSYADLSPKHGHSDAGHRPYRMNSSFAWNFQHPIEFKHRREKQLKYRKEHPRKSDRDFDDYGGYYNPLPASKVFPFGFAPGATGGAWAWTREAFDQVGGLLDSHIVGGADWNMALALIGQLIPNLAKRAHSPGYMKAALIWQENAAPLNANIGCVDCHAVHFFHGMHRNRAYTDRWKILEKHDYEPATDIKRDWQGLYQWSGRKPQMTADVLQYMLSRDEDSIELTEQSLV